MYIYEFRRFFDFTDDIINKAREELDDELDDTEEGMEEPETIEENDDCIINPLANTSVCRGVKSMVGT
jgi:hypothetical protein